MSDPVLAEYDCKHCNNTLRIKATPFNIENHEKITYCPFCGKEYE